MASNPHSDFTTHKRTLPTFSNLQLSPHKSESTSKTLILTPPPFCATPILPAGCSQQRGLGFHMGDLPVVFSSGQDYSCTVLSTPGE